MKRLLGKLRTILVNLGIIMLSISVVLGLRLSISPYIGRGVPLMLFLIAIVPPALMLGFWTGFFATFMATATSVTFFIGWDRVLHNRVDQARVAVFLFVGLACTIICVFARANRRKIDKLLYTTQNNAAREQRLREQIQAQDEEREAVRRSLQESNHQLEESHERFSRVARAANLGLWTWTEDQKFMSCSSECLEHLSLAPNESLYVRRLIDRIHPEDRAYVQGAVRRAIELGEVFDVTFRTMSRDPGTKWIKAAGWAEKTPGEPMRFDGITFDITAYKKAILEKEEAKLAAEKASLAKSRFLAQMSHEIRSPISAILGFTQILIDDQILLGPETASLLDRIQVNGDHLLHIIDDILDLTKFEAGEVTLEPIAFSPRELLLSVVQSFAPAADRRGIRVSSEVDPMTPFTIWSDPARLRQILFNLVGNAIKFTEQGTVKISLSLVGELLRFEIEDTGVGLRPEQVAKLFQPFEQADSSVNRKFGGTGLGLVLSRHLAVALGGDLQLSYSKPGQGSSFVFTASAHIGGAIALEPSSRSEVNPHHLNELKVLLAEDSPDGAAIICRYLTKAQAKVAVAANGFEVLEMVRAEDFDIVLMDLQMPGMDGFEATRRLRSAGFAKPIVALTAHALKEERDRSEAAGCNAHLIKPIDRHVLLEAIAGFTH